MPSRTLLPVGLWPVCETWSPHERGGQQGGAAASARSVVRVLPSTSCGRRGDQVKIRQQASCICSPKCFLKGTQQEGGRNTRSGRGEQPVLTQ